MNTVVQSATYYAWGADVTLDNPGGAVEDVTLVIDAKPLKILNKEKAIAQDEASIKENGKLRYVFPANPLVQTLDVAQDIADKLLAYYKNPRRDVTIEWLGNPALLLGDKISVEDSQETNDYYVTKQELEYSGYLRGRNLEGRKV